MADNYKIYSLSSSGDFIPRYIGYTGRDLNIRLNNHLYEKAKSKRVCWIKSVVNSGNSICIDLIEDNISKEDVKLKEIHYIKMFKSFGAKLVNGTNGGDGMINPTEETRKKMSLSHIGKPSPKKGRKFGKQSLEVILNRVQKTRGQKRLFTKEWKENISKGKTKNNILQFTKDGLFIKKWDNAVSIEKALKISNSSIYRACKGQRKSAKGFIWKYA